MSTPITAAPDIRIVLVEPTHPGNIGAVARAMKNMALQRLTLVAPREFPHDEAVQRAAGADDVLAAALVVATLDEALADCGWVLATTSRERDPNFKVLDVRDAAAQLLVAAARGPVAVMFGQERSGLTNEQLTRAHALVRIPANPDYSSLNISMAVQLLAYELYRARGAQYVASAKVVPLAPGIEMQRLYEHLQQVLTEVDFRDRTLSGTQLMTRIKAFLQRAELDINEAHILRGILTAVQARRRPAGSGVAAAAPLYLDYAATTPVDPRVAAAMAQCLTADGAFGNSGSATHGYGREAAQRIEQARVQVAALLGAAPADIVFTSGATESDNLAIVGAARANAAKRHLISVRTEHKAVLDAIEHLASQGYTVTWLTTDCDGRIDPRELQTALRSDTLLVSIMHANNETGVLQDIDALGAMCRAHGVLFHTDAAQSAGKLPIDVSRQPIDLLSFTAHKIYGPKGIGALYVAPRARAQVWPLLFGGGQERRLRPGTLATHQVVGFGAACELAAELRERDMPRLTALRNRLESALLELPGVLRNGHAAHRVGSLLNLSFDGLDGEALVAGLTDVALATGSACNSANGDPSYVLRALGRSTQLAQSSLRFSLGRHTTARDIERAIAAVRREVLRLRAAAPKMATVPATSATGPTATSHS